MHHDDKDGLHGEFDHDEVRDGQDDDDNRNQPNNHIIETNQPNRDDR